MASFDKLYLAVPADEFKNFDSYYDFARRVDDAVTNLTKDARRVHMREAIRFTQFRAVGTRSGFTCEFMDPIENRQRGLSLYFFGLEHDNDYVPQGMIAVTFMLGDFGCSEKLLREIRTLLPQYKAWLNLENSPAVEDLP